MPSIRQMHFKFCVASNFVVECQQTFVNVLKLVSYRPNVSTVKIPFHPLFEAPFHVASDSFQNVKREEKIAKYNEYTYEVVLSINISIFVCVILKEHFVCRLIEQIVDQMKLCFLQK